MAASSARPKPPPLARRAGLLVGGDYGGVVCFLEVRMDTKTLDRFGCLGNTIKLASGHYLDLLNPQQHAIDLPTIASALGKVCRFGAQCPRFYSVAEHCIHAVGLAAADGVGGSILQAILLHDATEAYLGDLTKPLKLLLPEYQVIEAKMELAIAERFGVDFNRYKDTVKRYDMLMLKAEKIAMWPEDAEEWTGFAGLPVRDVAFQFLMPDEASEWFASMAHALDLA